VTKLEIILKTKKKLLVSKLVSIIGKLVYKLISNYTKVFLLNLEYKLFVVKTLVAN